LQDTKPRSFYFRNLLAITLILGGYALYLLPQFIKVDGLKGFCLFHSATGIPCPGCGMGKASILLSQGEIIASMIIHPLALPFSIAAFTAIVWIVLDLIRKRETFLPLMKKKMRWPYFIVLLAAIAGVWGWNVVRTF
jgi:hypothetical protein